MDTASKTAVFDAIVVGSGPGGATVARELSRLGKTVLILERGSDAPVRESLVGFAAVANLVPVSEGLAVGRAFSTGGTTAIYFGVADMPPLQRFLSLGIDLSADLAEAKAELPIAVLSDELMGPQARTVREGALALGYAWEKRAFLVDQTACAAGYVANAKWSARQYVHEAVGRGATLLNEATVSKILVENDVAIGVEYRVKAGRSHDTRRAPCREDRTRGRRAGFAGDSQGQRHARGGEPWILLSAGVFGFRHGSRAEGQGLLRWQHGCAIGRRHIPGRCERSPQRLSHVHAGGTGDSSGYSFIKGTSPWASWSTMRPGERWTTRAAITRA